MIFRSRGSKRVCTSPSKLSMTNEQKDGDIHACAASRSKTDLQEPMLAATSPRLPKDVHHFAPPANLLVALPFARVRHDIPRAKSRNTGASGNGVAHERGGTEIVGIDDGELAAAPVRPDVIPSASRRRTKRVPMSGRRHQDHALPIRDRRRGETTNSAVEKLLVLIEPGLYGRAGPAFDRSPDHGSAWWCSAGC